MSAALTYVDYFLPVSSLDDIQFLEKTMKRLIA
jgi:hypothetical protein